ncbi:NAD(P)-binding protein [Cylindrobasidium torrendii FP15055 ss-10]|uniref:NAD(P)-binding protein n=1 Tax=Cylindrobasidium torrendii FP15055 ss-10 TaxID=1314674 RepID=A0A0D7B8N0_9AGAR|nr:NAD(P)-binding protein [Cylindrobasidium torrendii FP15055 ss-10]
MPAHKTNILFIGATGYLGGSILLKALALPDVSITAFVRNADKAEKLRELDLQTTVSVGWAQRLVGRFKKSRCSSDAGVKVVVGSPNTDTEALEKLVAQADIIIDAYSADDLPGSKNIIEAATKSSKRPHVIHFTGLAVIVDNAGGQPSKFPAWDDTDIPRLRTIPAQALHNDVDQEFLKADEQGHLYSYLFAPGAVFGQPSGALVDAGLQTASEFFPDLVLGIVKTAGGDAAGVGEGLNAFSVVHVDDATDLAILLVKKILSDKGFSHGWDGYYFASNGSVTLKDMVLAASNGLKKGQAAEYRALTADEISKAFPHPLFAEIVGSNAEAEPTRGKALGWSPKKGPVEYLEAVTLLASKSQA